ncbi:hypothetical protein ACOSQ3_005236 [Xanthoceras sorbifolium]
MNSDKIFVLCATLNLSDDEGHVQRIGGRLKVKGSKKMALCLVGYSNRECPSSSGHSEIVGSVAHNAVGEGVKQQDPTGETIPQVSTKGLGGPNVLKGFQFQVDPGPQYEYKNEPHIGLSLNTGVSYGLKEVGHATSCNVVNSGVSKTSKWKHLAHQGGQSSSDLGWFKAPRKTSQSCSQEW